MLTIDEYKALLGAPLDGLSDDDVAVWYRCHVTFVSFLLKAWLRSRGRDTAVCDTTEP